MYTQLVKGLKVEGGEEFVCMIIAKTDWANLLLAGCVRYACMPLLHYSLRNHAIFPSPFQNVWLLQ